MKTVILFLLTFGLCMAGACRAPTKVNIYVSHDGESGYFRVYNDTAKSSPYGHTHLERCTVSESAVVCKEIQVILP